MEEELDEIQGKEYLDQSYMKKTKYLCHYCSYRAAVPSKNNQYCSEMCRLLHLCITKQLDLPDIAKLIRCSKVDLIDIILTLKCQKLDLVELHKVVGIDRRYKQKGLKVNHNTTGEKVLFD